MAFSQPSKLAQRVKAKAFSKMKAAQAEAKETPADEKKELATTQKAEKKAGTEKQK
jgi:hypothetical protein